ncbi:MAG: hypothetical protein EOP53_26170 [Sphingobacteriales bacterium]|nr:MAG: hypothetical protein EOP53_26170 [Sphingobacteriales bacterium]
MQDKELHELLNAYNHKLEEARLLNLQSWVLNLQNYTYQQKQKANNKLSKLTLQKKVLVILGIVYGLGLLFLAANTMSYQKMFFSISTAAIGSITLYAVVVYLQQLNLIYKFNNADNIVEAQEKLIRLQDSTLSVTRILFLQTPFYCLFFVSPAMIAASPLSFLLISLPIALVFASVSLWLYYNIDIKNADKKWFRILFGSSEWKNLVQSQRLLDDIEEFKKDIVDR